MSLIEFREPVEDDLPWLIQLNLKHKDKFLADGESLPDDIPTLYAEYFNLDVLASKRAIVFTVPDASGARVPIGSADFTDINHDLTAVLHFILEPQWVRTFLKDKVYLDALLDRFRVIGVRKFLVVSEFFCTTAHKLAQAIGFKKVATLTDIVRYKRKTGDIFTYEVGDLFYFELTRKDLARELAKQFISEETAPELPAQDSKVTKLPRKRRNKVNEQ